MKKFLSLTTLLMSVICASAQTATVKGMVADTLNKENLQNAVVTLLGAKDSVIASFTRSSKTGTFTLTSLPPGDFTLLIAYPAFADYVAPVTLKAGETQDLGTIKMTLKAKLLQDVLVKQKIAAVRMRGDTLEYNADSFKVREGASVEEMLRKMPGLQVDKDGKITAQGQKIEKVLVDGEEFFGDDPTMATKNLQADAIDKVQVFDKKSDQAAFTGIDDGKKTKTLNLTLKEDKKKGYFGKVELSGDLKQRWNNSLMLNRFKAKRKLSGYGIMSSTGKTGLDWDESSKFGGGNNFEYDEDGGYFFSNYSDDELSSGAFNGQGIPKSWSAGLQYSQKYNEDKQNINASYRYNKLNTAGGSNTISQSILPGSVFNNAETKNSFGSRDRHSANGTYEWQLDSATSIKVKGDAYAGHAQSFTNYHNTSISDVGTRVAGMRTTTSDGNDHTLNANFLLRHRFKKAGRTVSLAFDEQSKTTKSSGFLYSTNSFFDKDVLSNIDTVDQRKVSEVINAGYYTRVSYTEPIVKNVFMELSYGLRISNSDSKKLSYDKNLAGKYEALNGLYSNSYNFHGLTNSGGMMWRLNSKKYTASAGGDVAFADFTQKDLINNTRINYSYTNFFPKANFTYKINATSRFNIGYNGSTNQPRVEQIQPIRDNTNPLNVAIGNPNLKQEFRHSINFNFNNYKVLKQRGIYIYAYINTTTNSISTNETTITRKDSAGIRTYQYVNLNGNYSGYSGFGYNFKASKLDMNFNVGGNVSVGRNNNIVNTLDSVGLVSKRNRTDNNSFGINFSTSKFKEKKYDIGYYVNASYNMSNSSVNRSLKTNYWTQVHNLYVNVDLPWHFTVNTSVEANLRQKTALFSGRNNVYTWNAYIGRKLLKNDKGLISFRANDLLDQNKGYNRYINSNILTEQNYDRLRRYFLVAFTWNFSKTPGGATAP